MRKSYLRLSILLLICNYMFPAIGMTQAAPAAAAAPQSSWPFDLDTALFSIALTLAVCILVLVGLLRTAIKYHFKNKMGGGTMKSVIAAMVFMGFSAHASAQAAAAPAAKSDYFILSPQGWILLLIIAVELLILIYLVKWIKQFTGISSYTIREVQAKGPSWWDRINAFKPIEQEGNIDTGHNYDGIRELDNVTPPWFLAAFAGTIVFAGIYLYRYHVAHAAPLMIEEFNIAMETAAKEKMEYLKTQANLIDENSVTELEPGKFEEGKTIFKTACAVCHGDKGQGVVGPNLTDEYWLHGGSVKNIFTVIKYGVIDKGMKSWKDDYSPNQIAQLASYIRSLKGTNPPNPKDPQGDIYKETAGAPAAQPGQVAPPKDSTGATK